MASYGSSVLPAPRVIQLPNFSGTIPAGYTAGCVSLTAFFPPVTLHVQVSAGAGLRLPTLGGEGAAQWLSLTRLSSSAPMAATVSGAWPMGLLVGLQNLLPPVSKRRLHTLASKLHIN